MSKNLIKLNLGCGTRHIDGYINIDNATNVLLSRFNNIKNFLCYIGILPKNMSIYDLSSVKYMKLPHGLNQFKNGSASRIYSCHFIEHVSKDHAIKTLSECYRILEKNGIMRVVAPDSLIYTKKYVAETEHAISNNQFTVEARDQLFDILVGGFHEKKSFFRASGKEHLFFWDIPSMCKTLETIGFKNIEICSYQKGKDQEMANVDNYPEVSFFIEAEK